MHQNAFGTMDKMFNRSSTLNDGTFSVQTSGATSEYERMHRILAQGNFVLSVNEGFLNGIHSSFYDLYRIADDKLVEHWDTTEAIPPRSQWKNDNGKF